MTIDGKKQIIDDFWLEHQDPESLYIPSNYRDLNYILGL